MAFKLILEHFLSKLLFQSFVVDFSYFPKKHVHVDDGVEMVGVQLNGFFPFVLCFLVFALAHQCKGLFVLHVNRLPDEWLAQLVVSLVEKLAMFLYQQVFDELQLALSLRNSIQLNALYQDLNERSGLSILCPRQRQRVERNGVLIVACTSDHQL